MDKILPDNIGHKVHELLSSLWPTKKDPVITRPPQNGSSNQNLSKNLKLECQTRRDDVIYSMTEVASHWSSESCWVVIGDVVYDVTQFVVEHPGGEDIILENGGCDVTVAFMDVAHSEDALKVLKKYRIGGVLQKDPVITRPPQNGSSNQSSNLIKNLKLESQTRRDDVMYNMTEVANHCSSESCWVVVRDVVYDVTQFLAEHPGGEEIILENGGCDATVAFMDVAHSEDALKVIEKYRIGCVRQ